MKPTRTSAASFGRLSTVAPLLTRGEEYVNNSWGKKIKIEKITSILDFQTLLTSKISEQGRVS